MTLTRRLEIYICEDDKEVKKELYSQLYNWRYLIVNGANEMLSYLYSIDRLKYYKFITEQSKIDLGITGARGEPVKEGSAGYVLLSERMKGKVPTDILNCLQKTVTKKYTCFKPALFKGTCSLFTYKNNTPIPFSSISIKNLRWNQDLNHFEYTLFGISFGITLGRDRSNNKKVLEYCINNTYELCESSILIDDTKRKLFLLLCYKCGSKTVLLNDAKSVDASLSAETPIIATFEGDVKLIGNREEFMYRRLQIQSAMRRAQINSKFSAGGKGRKRKFMAVSNFHNKERDYIKTRLHTYSKILVDFAVANRCKHINLINQTNKEKRAKCDPFLLRNWSYYGLKKFIEYKAKLWGIEVRILELPKNNLESNIN
ncbi:MAG: hypothetical protein A2X17_02020 [Bacteroidetes bacterium GWF2_41_61]|nr:MAG: hypothetical protein A2X20_02790 [Bacteroidetes bacterium GWE2_40_15]OFY33909.1 MAG: hypothetical protein A2X17_02020 [Bacteroidetes bacterium GWF2_41_61]OFY89176.1 MAG: hypothetical protein A2266_00865 [Bacteroidetes bacterium RIFOXYA12_FULL_40_10]HBG25411.1 hypothetical protein [Rikenellaceae bacterium]HBZ25286.1 hypothetical protein [Rikenellaceae bacterium]